MEQIKSFQTEVMSEEIGMVFIPQRDEVLPDNRKYKYITHFRDNLNTSIYSMIKPKNIDVYVGDVVTTINGEGEVVQAIDFGNNIRIELKEPLSNGNIFISPKDIIGFKFRAYEKTDSIPKYAIGDLVRRKDNEVSELVIESILKPKTAFNNALHFKYICIGTEDDKHIILESKLIKCKEQK